MARARLREEAMMRPRKSFCSVIFILVNYCSSLSGSEPFHAETGRESHDEHWIWRPDRFSVPRLTRFAEALRSRAVRPVNRALIFSSRDEAASVAWGKGMFDYPYELWRT